MSDYESLNLPQLLALMNDIVRPEPTAWTPQTTGWAIVGAWFVVVLAFVGWHGYRHWRNNRYRREALAALSRIAAQAEFDSVRAAQQLGSLLKRTALATYARTDVAKLYGADWAAFLCRTAGDDPLVRNVAAELASAAYRADVDVSALLAPARRWIEVHRA